MLAALGWNEEFQRHFQILSMQRPGLKPARVVEHHRSHYRLRGADGPRTGQMSGRFAFEAASGESPTTGDWVAISDAGADAEAVIHALVPRKSAFVRRGPNGIKQVVAANLDLALVVSSLNGDLNARRIERYMSLARDAGVEPVVVLTKADAQADPSAALAQIAGATGDAPVLIVSALTGMGLEALAARLQTGKTAALLGSSGVGKSTLVNALAGTPLMATAAISGDHKRGRHTTTHRQLVALASGAWLLDTPGMREVSVAGADEGVASTFADVEALIAACRFTDCAHGREPGCAVRAALEDGRLEAPRWASHQKLQRELAFSERKDDPRLRAAERKRWVKLHGEAKARSKLRGKD